MDLHEALERHEVDAAAAGPLAALLEALAREPDPHTTVPAEDTVDVHVADSLAALAVPELRTARAIADLGAGAGFPGLPLAVALPRARVDLIESARRKVAVIERLIEAAGIRNARAIAARAEDWAAGEGREAYDAVCARAVGSLALLVEYAAPLLADGGSLIAWKGRRDPAEEEAGAAAAAQLGLEPAGVLAVEPYPASRDRHLHLYRKSGPTPAGFPRRPGIARKRPLA
ncbi:MAG: rRNA (guanine527-N7)-methyltransferase [Thermoleophilaceae bacterium]|nr:rRNA (guanine527-N7)-methyltransferase [Thermoleophilaceae bacterium]